MTSAPPASTDVRPGFAASIPAPGALIAVTLILALAAAGLAAWLWGGLRAPPVVERVIPALPAQLAPNLKAKAEALTEEAKKLESQLQGLNAQPAACPPGTLLKTEAEKIAPAPAPVPAPLAAPASQPPAAAAAAATDRVVKLSAEDLTARLESAAALVLTKDSVATGFFIGETLLLTNRHAVESAADKRVLIVSRSLGGARPGEVLRMSPSGQPGAEDFALVRLRQGKAPGVLAFSNQAPKLSAVTAAGYPGLTLRSDDGFRRLSKGDAGAAPDLNLTQGVVQSLQTTPQGAAVILHTASVLQGNSGGPLVDACGRAVGVNTFIAVDAEHAGRTSYAQTAGGVAAFLSGVGVSLAVDARPCAGP